MRKKEHPNKGTEIMKQKLVFRPLLNGVSIFESDNITSAAENRKGNRGKKDTNENQDGDIFKEAGTKVGLWPVEPKHILPLPPATT